MGQRDDSPGPGEPKPIRRLDQSLVNRIAAGEIIHRPSSALKELLENSLDAGSKSIRVTVKDGGLKLLQIQDDGSGIRKNDLPILCERFTTSKISNFSDLQSIATYGFRGEALASISFVSHLTVVTKTREDSCAWKVSYSEGSPVPPKPGQSVDAKPCAGNDGTLITVEDLFYNTPTRMTSLRSNSDEYGRVLDVVSRYAIHNPAVAFSCKKAGSSTPDISTPGNSSVSSLVRLLHGSTIAHELVHISLSSSASNKGKRKAREDDMDEDDDSGDGIKWGGEAYVTNANYHVKKMTFLLFINHRSVESSRIKRAVESTYTAILPKGMSPFVYLSLNIDPASVDVNVHPTKREVHFLDEEEIIESIVDKIQTHLVSRNDSRTFEYQTLITSSFDKSQSSIKKIELRDRGSKFRDDDEQSGVDSDTEAQAAAQPSSSKQNSSTLKAKVVPPQRKFRSTTQNNRTLDGMFLPVPSPSSSSSAKIGGPSSEKDWVDGEDGEGAAPDSTPRKNPDNRQAVAPLKLVESGCYLQSILDLREEIKAMRHTGLSEVFADVAYIGIVDLARSITLVQHSTNLYLINHSALAEELFYQLGARQFGDFGKLHLDPPPSIRSLLELSVPCEMGISEAGLTVESVIDTITALLIDQREMLQEYFAMNITENGDVESLPLLLGNYTPDLDRLPLLLMRLGPQVDWTEEKACFQSILRELAYFYTPIPLKLLLNSPSSTVSNTHAPKISTTATITTQDKGERAVRERWQIEHVLIPAFRSLLVPTKNLLDAKAIVQVASLPELYRVFERC